MKTLHGFASATVLLPWFICSSLLAHDSPKLPDQYAEAVLYVEGMI